MRISASHQSCKVCLFRVNSFYCVGIDLMGPMQISRSGSQHVVGAIVYLTKWPEVALKPDKNPRVVAEFFMRDVIARHGCPKEVLSENGGKFLGGPALTRLHDRSQANKPFRITLKLMGWLSGSPAHLAQHFANVLLKDSPSDWDQLIPTVLLDYRATRHCLKRCQGRF